MKKMYAIGLVLILSALVMGFGIAIEKQSEQINRSEINFNTTAQIAKTNEGITISAQPATIYPSCSNADYINSLVAKAAYNHTYILDEYDCTQYSYALGEVLLNEGCDFRLVTGWYGEVGSERSWHRWIETPYFQIEPQLGIITPSAQSLYSKSYATDWNFNHEYG